VHALFTMVNGRLDIFSPCTVWIMLMFSNFKVSFHVRVRFSTIFCAVVLA